MFKMIACFAGMFVMESSAALRAVKEVSSLVARKGSSASKFACSRAKPGDPVHRRCVQRFWCNTDNLRRTEDVAEAQEMQAHFERNGCPATQIDYLRERECMRLCARRDCDHDCALLCEGVSLDSLVFGAELEGRLSRTKRRLTSQRDITLDKVERLHACLQNARQAKGMKVEIASPVKATGALNELKTINKRLHSKFVSNLGKLKKELTRLYEVPHLLQRGIKSMKQGARKRRDFPIPSAARFVFDGAAHEAWSKEDVIPSKEFEEALHRVIDVKIEPLTIKREFSDKRRA